jgi:FkbM family methyltransferase
MIPKVIHYCWFGNNAKTPLINDCISSWKRQLTDYKFVEWNEDNYPIIHPFAKEAYKAKKWAFLADYARFDILYREGGIYLDTDMYLLKNLDTLLSNACFFGYEDINTISFGIIGAEKEHPAIEDCLSAYDKLPFSINLPPITTILNNILVENKNLITVYPVEYFYALPLSKRGHNFHDYITPKSYAVHLWNASWFNEWQLFENGFKSEALAIVRNKLKKQPFQPLSYYTKLIKKIFPKNIKNAVKDIIGLFIRVGSQIPLIKLIIIHKRLIPYYFKDSYIPNEENFELTDIKVITRNNIKLKVNLGEHNGWRIYYNIFNLGTEKLFNQIQNKQTIIDVGANLGYYTLNFAKKNPDGNIIAFEPYHVNHNVLTENVSLNKFKNISCFQMGLGASNTTSHLSRINDRNLGMVQINNNQIHNNTNSINITTLDYFLTQENISQIDLIKVDIEGYEYEFLKGAEQTLKSFFPTLFIEICDKNLRKYNTTPNQVIDFLENLGYDYLINANSGEQIYSFYNFKNCFFDMLCKKTTI